MASALASVNVSSVATTALSELITVNVPSTPSAKSPSIHSTAYNQPIIDMVSVAVPAPSVPVTTVSFLVFGSVTSSPFRFFFYGRFIDHDVNDFFNHCLIFYDDNLRRAFY